MTPAEMQARLAELEETLRAIRQGEVDALLVSAPEGDRVYTLQGADHPYRVMIETINEGAATLNAAGLVLYVNRRFAEMVGLPIEEVTGSDLHNFVSGLDPCHLDEMLARAETRPLKQECDLRTADGRVLPVHLSFSPLRCGDFQGICLIATDWTDQKRREEQLARANNLLRAEIAERKRAQDAIRKTEDIFQVFMNHAPVLVFLTDREGRYVFCSDKLEELFGIKLETLLGRTAADWAPGAIGKVLHEHDLAALSGHESTEIVEQLPTATGETAYLLMVRFPFVDASGRRLLAGVGVDITAQRRAEHSLRQLSGRLLRLQDQERRRIARDLHDGTGQTLSALALNLALLENFAPLSRNLKAREALTRSIGLAQQAANEIRDLSHLLHPPDLDTMGLVSAIQSHSRQVSRVTGIDLNLELLTEKSRLPEDIETTLFRVFQESLENVRRHSGSRTARIRLSHDGERIVLEVEDDGRGTPPDLLTGERPNGAPGIGVAGMRERVQQLGGRLEIKSGNRGTKVRAMIPVAQA